MAAYPDSSADPSGPGRNNNGVWEILEISSGEKNSMEATDYAPRLSCSGTGRLSRDFRLQDIMLHDDFLEK